MMGIISKLFGGKKEGSVSDKALDIIEDCLNGVFDRGGLDLDYEIDENDSGQVVVELFGKDEELLRQKEGQLLDSLQFFVKRVLQHKLQDERVDLIFDTNGYREEADKALVDLAERLKGIVLQKKKSAYVRALPPRERRVIHQHLAGDKRVKTRSIGDGHFKKIKIFPANSGGRRNSQNSARSQQ
jgi:spoIIIJ-associated protein